MDKKKYKEIDIMRGIAIILVIVGHAIIVHPINLHEIYWCKFMFEWISSVHMPMFFIISGFCNIMPNIFLLNSVIEYMVFFIIGYMIKLHLVNKKGNVSEHKMETVHFVVAIMFWIVSIYIIVGFGNNKIIDFIAAILGIIVIYYFVDKIKNKNMRFVSECSKYSLPLYLLNGYLLVVTRVIMINKLGVINPIIIISTNIIVTLFISMIIIKFFVDRIRLLDICLE